MATKKEIMEQLDELGVEYRSGDSKATLELVLEGARLLLEPVRFSGRVLVDHLNVREVPGGEIVGQLGKGVPIYGALVGDWVELDNGGYIKAEFVQELKL